MQLLQLSNSIVINTTKCRGRKYDFKFENHSFKKDAYRLIFNLWALSKESSPNLPAPLIQDVPALNSSAEPKGSFFSRPSPSLNSVYDKSSPPVPPNLESSPGNETLATQQMSGLALEPSAARARAWSKLVPFKRTKVDNKAKRKKQVKPPVKITTEDNPMYSSAAPSEATCVKQSTRCRSLSASGPQGSRLKHQDSSCSESLMNAAQATETESACSPTIKISSPQFLNVLEKTELQTSLLCPALNLFHQNGPMYSMLSADDWDVILRGAKKEVYPTSTEIVRQGECLSRMYYIIEGVCSVRIPSDTQQGFSVLRQLKNTAIFGETCLLGRDFASRYTVVAESPVTLALVEICFLETVFARDVSLSARFFYHLSRTAMLELIQGRSVRPVPPPRIRSPTTKAGSCIGLTTKERQRVMGELTARFKLSQLPTLE